MKKLFFMSLIMLLSITSVYATCNDEELNEWAVKTEVTFNESQDLKAEDLGYAYFLSVTPLRDDIVIKVTDGNGDMAEAERFTEEGLYDFYAVGCYTNLEEETYTIKIYGGEKSKCKNELLKTLTYTVPRFNRMVYYQVCEDHPEHELCQTYTNKTKEMTEQEFKKEMSKYEKKEKESQFDLTLKGILSYLLYLLVPFTIITIIYIFKRKKIKKIESEK